MWQEKNINDFEFEFNLPKATIHIHTLHFVSSSKFVSPRIQLDAEQKKDIWHFILFANLFDILHLLIRSWCDCSITRNRGNKVIYSN